MTEVERRKISRSLTWVTLEVKEAMATGYREECHNLFRTKRNRIKEAVGSRRCHGRGEKQTLLE